MQLLQLEKKAINGIAQPSSHQPISTAAVGVALRVTRQCLKVRWPVPHRQRQPLLHYFFFFGKENVCEWGMLVLGVRMLTNREKKN